METDFAILHHREGVDVLPSNINLSAMEISLVNVMSRELVLKRYIERIMQKVRAEDTFTTKIYAPTIDRGKLPETGY